MSSKSLHVQFRKHCLRALIDLAKQARASPDEMAACKPCMLSIALVEDGLSSFCSYAARVVSKKGAGGQH